MVEASERDYGAIEGAGSNAAKGALKAVKGVLEKARTAVSADFPGETSWGLSKGTVAALAYAGWLIGAFVVYFRETDSTYVHFHASQAIIVWVVLWLAFAVCTWATYVTTYFFSLLLNVIVGAAVSTGAFLAYKAYTNGPSDIEYRVPYVADYADKLAS